MKQKYLSNVVTLQLDVDTCIGCGMCTQVCPQGVFVVEDKKARIIDRDACMECGACAMNCPSAAISVRSGVGCAVAVIKGALKGNGTDCCGDGDSTCCG